MEIDDQLDKALMELRVFGSRQKMGVGIPGMHARLQQFGGDLKIRTRSGGTSLLAYVPLSERSKGAVLSLSRRAAPRLRARWQAERTF
jgi:two-component system, NarL family, sensor kinase